MWPLANIQQVLLALFLGVCIGSVGMLRVMLWKADADQLKLVEAAAKNTIVIRDVVHEVETKVVTEVIEIQGKGITIREEVPVYVTKTDDEQCRINNGFVRVYNAGVFGKPPAPASDSDRGPSDATLSTVARVSAENHTAFLELNARLDGCIGAYNAVREKVNASSN